MNQRAVLLGLVLLGGSVLDSGCASPCAGTSGSCLALEVTGSVTGDLTISLQRETAPGASELKMGMRLPGVSLPRWLRIVPPPGWQSSQVRSVQARLTEESGGGSVYESSTLLQWPDGEHITEHIALTDITRPESVSDNGLPDSADMGSPDLRAPFSLVAVPSQLSGLGFLDIKAADLATARPWHIATANAAANTISLVRISSGGSVELAGTPTRVGDNPSSIAAFDLDKDGTVDLAVLSQQARTVNFVKVQPDGSLSLPKQVWDLAGTMHAPADPHVANLVDDGAPDLAMVNGAADGAVLVLAGSQVSGPLGGAMHVYSTAGAGPAALVLGDFQSDGWLDLVVANRDSNEVRILRNTTGVIGSAELLDRGQRPIALAVGMLDRDAWPDLAVAYSGGAPLLRVLNNRGDGSFRLGVDLPLPQAPLALAAVDVDQDGSVDIAVLLDGDPGGILIFPGPFPGPAAAGWQFSTSGKQPSAWMVGDLNRDGAPDFLVAHRGSAQVQSLLTLRK